jgi:hypothetical protein
LPKNTRLVWASLSAAMDGTDAKTFAHIRRENLANDLVAAGSGGRSWLA